MTKLQQKYAEVFCKEELTPEAEIELLKEFSLHLEKPENKLLKAEIKKVRDDSLEFLNEEIDEPPFPDMESESSFEDGESSGFESESSRSECTKSRFIGLLNTEICK